MLVQLLELGDSASISTFSRSSVMFVVEKMIVKEGPICVIHGENDSQLIFMNSNLLNYN